MKKLWLAATLITLVGITALGCVQDKAAAENITSSFFEAIRKKDFDTALTFYSSKFFELNPNVDWLQVLKGVNKKLGDLENYELTTYNLKKTFGTAENGTYCELQYKVTYSKYSATETFTLFKSATGGEYSIVGHKINSIGLALE